MCDSSVEFNLQNEIYEFIVTEGFQEDMDNGCRSLDDPLNLLKKIVMLKPTLTSSLLNNLAVVVILCGFYSQNKVLLKIALQYYKLLDNKVKLALIYSHKLNKWIPELFDEIYIDCMDMEEFDWQYMAHMFFYYNKLDEVRWILENTEVKGTLTMKENAGALIIPKSGRVSYFHYINGNFVPKIIEMPLQECSQCKTKHNLIQRNNLRWPTTYCRSCWPKGTAMKSRLFCKLCKQSPKKLLGTGLNIFCCDCVVKVLIELGKFGCFCGCDQKDEIPKNLRQDQNTQHVYGHHTIISSRIKSLLKDYV